MRNFLFYPKKKLIISLIKDDLRRTRMVHGFSDMGINAFAYTSGLSESIFILSGISPRHFKIDEILEGYIDLTKKVLEIDIENPGRQLDKLAAEAYAFLFENRSNKKVIMVERL